MPVQPYIDQISERVDRLLLRHEELQRVNQLLQQQLESMRLERDQLRQQCLVARQRLDALIGQMPAESQEPEA